MEAVVLRSWPFRIPDMSESCAVGNCFSLYTDRLPLTADICFGGNVKSRELSRLHVASVGQRNHSSVGMKTGKAVELTDYFLDRDWLGAFHVLTAEC